MTVDVDELPLVSVIIAAYNAERFLAYAVESVLRQTYARYEIIIVNDGSADDTQRVISAMTARDRRVQSVNLAANGGVSAARNAGIRAAKGDWIAILDADDAYPPTRLENLMRFARQHELDMVADQLEMIEFPDGAHLGNAFADDWIDPDHDITARFMLERDIPGEFKREIGYVKPLIRVAFLEHHGISYAADIKAAEDFLLCMECLQAGAKFRLSNASHYICRRRPGSESSSGGANIGSKAVNLRLMDSVQGWPRPCAELLALRLRGVNYELLNWHVKQGQWRAAFGIAAELPFGFAVKTLIAHGLRKLGIQVASPAARALAALRDQDFRKNP